MRSSCCIGSTERPKHDRYWANMLDRELNSPAPAPHAELVWLIEHPPLYTAGISAKPSDLLDPQRFPVFQSERGGQFTYHGPGQRVAYVMLDLRERGRDARLFVAGPGGLGDRRPVRPGRRRLDPVGPRGRVGGAMCDPPREDKIAALGVKLRRWVSFHGISLNVRPSLDHFAGIVPCGQTEHGVTSLEDLGVRADMTVVDEALELAFTRQFGPVRRAHPPV
jgi:lipoyl(octanoyl) transferase